MPVLAPRDSLIVPRETQALVRLHKQARQGRVPRETIVQSLSTSRTVPWRPDRVGDVAMRCDAL